MIMATISVPLTPELEERLDQMVDEGVGPNRAAVMRHALERLAEDEAIQAVLRAQHEVRMGKVLRGDPRKILLDGE